VRKAHHPLDFGGDPARPADRVVLGDSRAVAEGCRDLATIYIDPPFGTGLTQRGRRGAYRDGVADPDDFVAWLEPWLAASRDALAPDGSLFVHLDHRAVHYVKVALDRLFGRACFAGEIVWCYAVGGKSRRSFGRKHDTILWYGRTPAWAFHRDAVRVPRRGGSHMRVVDGVQEKTDRKTGRVYRYPVVDGKVPEDWWADIETLNHSDRERTGWPSQKPERLIERILTATSLPGQKVADWFVGSGTTAAVAQRLGRGFVVADRAPEAIETTIARLERQGWALPVPPPRVEIEASSERVCERASSVQDEPAIIAAMVRSTRRGPDGGTPS
jgi:DNA modification methylase